MALQQSKILQLLRSDVKDSKSAALLALEGATANLFGDDLNYDGAPLVVRYHTNKDGADDEVKSLFVIFHKNAAGKTGYTVFDNADEADAALEEFKQEVAETIGISGFDGTDGKDGKDALADELKNTTYAKDGAKGEDGETIVDAIKALDDAIVANKVASADNSVVVTKAEDGSGTDLSVNVDGKTLVISTVEASKGKISTAVKIQYVAAVPATEDTEAVPAHIALMDNEDKALSTVSVEDLIGNGQLVNSSYDKTTGILTLTFQKADGTTQDVQVDLKDMLDLNDVIIASDSQNYLSVSPVETVDHYEDAQGNTISKEAYAALDDEAKQAYTPVYSEKGIELSTNIVSLENATARNTGLADAYDVKQNLDAANAEVKALEAAVGGEYHLAEGENPAKFDTQLSGVTYAEEFAAKTGVAAIASTDTLVQAIEKVESSVKVLVDEVLDNEEVSEKTIEALANAAGVITSDGVITYTKHTEVPYINNAENLDDADVALANAISALSASVLSTKHTEVVAKEGDVISALTEHKTDVATGAKYDKVTLSLEYAEASTVANEANKAGLVKTTENKLDVSFDFGTFTL